ncbi:FliC/FljB family flagellin [Pluralibacter gergoviae]|uniref:FliC/FljB family flagellin n=1 Tax=Pluralibacter gergoviae TaxID=61647 RepID=UPI001FF26B14|nr:FliC/FljB family flagellin [Pluralibacter gergoviae]MCK1065570.1 FliC/FljB family flagellin [Pluralibacter gergoviae]MCV7758500.1 FliC/FljB family flagellin [Pluralibacter gergoviae]HDS1234721.1 FliC/FljB family flagellin [Pluralibacter gergoviae]HDS1241065.1 FliC/FljB family flagellin [Pluralibacter gergoviae]HDS1247064.1 FliC/FljB family flagellin [Pluralibacter gergoviae]
MAQVINTNTLSLVAQNNLNKSQASLGTAIQRLSSGLRINSAKDDAAGQAISNRFTANINGLTQASRNANDGISIAQTTEGALNEINDNLQNIRRLTTQAQNGTNSDSDRQSIQDEIDARLQEIDRISQQTEFNGVKVLSKDQALSIQVGANDGQTIDIQLNKIDASTLGMDTFNATKTAIKLHSGSNIQDSDDPDDATKSCALGDDFLTDLTTAVTDKVGEVTDLYQTADGSYIAVGEKGAIAVKATVTPQSDDGAGNITPASIAWAADGDVLSAGDVAKDGIGQLKTIDDALAQVDKLRSGLGAVQNRFDSVISNLDSTVNNLSASRSRIQDADFASEVSNMSRANILQQAGVTVLGQANQVPQNVLSLLR